MFWALGMGGRGGLLIAGPVLLGLAAGWFLDNRFGTLPWITLALTLVGAVVGPFLAYRWITDAVQRRVKRSQAKAQEGEDS
jgi:F0F1-type ATP synthase assembly protein I